MANIQWALDPMHSELQFKIKHLMISTVTGYLKQFDLRVETTTDDFSTASGIDFSADVHSIDTNNESRDAHLRSADFFNAAEHPGILFKGRKYEKPNGEEAKIQGDLTIKGISRPVTLNVEFGGIVKDPHGQTKAGFTVTGRISRKEFGLTWSAVTEAGQVVVGDDIRIQAEIQLIRQA